ncbi:unnamed protein product (macronuclear) [Paramecium tetraurelia]|uniref:TRAF3-interacting protein 1 N-terminal domain-containing protein n=1 Tax=Paramecium tetraurelia TaxID=5888 RepID=A0BFP5_PARTE|nr:uncharacterized protein GSPATT00028397001 [Paramecium tetraurelia]CAK57362.1 unnamed protein product [Paramecium tetraurelia]|eukprot:XP_001424760.1 hypothetical protein (macronuclear) [Paramecium tetraurelia strain d4-2]
MADFWKPTADLYSALFEKPKMSQKLLEKPPFKYIFDIIMETTKQTGFKFKFPLGYAKGLYTTDELDGNSYDNKDKKLMFLQKIIDLTSMMLKEEIAAKPGKIAAGLEPENTNLLLQAIYRAAVSGKNSDPFVKKILGGAGAKEPEPQKKEQPKPEPKAQQPPPKEQSAPQVKDEKRPDEKKPAQPKEDPKPKQQAQQPPPQQPKENQKQQQVPPPQQQQQQTQEGNVRPSTAKKRPPQLPSNQVQVEQNQKKGGTANVIIEGKGNNDEDDGIVVQSNVRPTSDINAQEYGKFVRDNMKNQEKAKEEEKEKDQPQEGIKMKRIGNVNQRKDKIKEEIAQNLGTSQVSDTIVMQKLIQSMSQNVNPLAKQIEFIQDDIENMNRELQQWRKIYNVSKQKMVDMNRATEEAQQPLYDKIAEVEEVIKEKKSKIQNIKAQIIKNKLQIDQLLKAVLVQK